MQHFMKLWTDEKFHDPEVKADLRMRRYNLWSLFSMFHETYETFVMERFNESIYHGKCTTGA